MQKDLFGNPLPPAAQENVVPPPLCGECRHCKQTGTIYLCHAPTSWGGLSMPYKVNPTAAACADYKPNPNAHK